MPRTRTPKRHGSLAAIISGHPQLPNAQTLNRRISLGSLVGQLQSPTRTVRSHCKICTRQAISEKQQYEAILSLSNPRTPRTHRAEPLSYIRQQEPYLQKAVRILNLHPDPLHLSRIHRAGMRGHDGLWKFRTRSLRLCIIGAKHSYL